MPLYEYRCDACGHRFERIQKFADPLVEVCPSCSGLVRKLISSPAFQFKGSGWYVTDYARSGKPEGAETDGAKADRTGEPTARTDKTGQVEKTDAAAKAGKSEKSEKAETRPAASSTSTTDKPGS